MHPKDDVCAWRIMLCDDPLLAGHRLSSILDSQGFEVVMPSRAGLPEAESGEQPPRADLVMLAFDCAEPAALDRLREIRRPRWVRQVPILGITSFDSLALDIEVLRSHGVIGLVDRKALPENVLDRIDRILRPSGARRASERASCFFPVEVEIGRVVSHEYALDLSATGMRLTAAEPLEPNTDLRMRFRLPVVDDELIAAEGRTVRLLSKLNSAGRHELGVFFYPLEPRYRKIVECEVGRLLAD